MVYSPFLTKDAFVRVPPFSATITTGTLAYTQQEPERHFPALCI